MVDPKKKVFNIIEKYSSDTFQVVQKYETIDILWGIEYRKLTDNDIKALKEGKYLYCNNGEYAQLISYQSQESEDKDADKKCTYKETGCGSCKRQLDCPIEADKSERTDA